MRAGRPSRLSAYARLCVQRALAWSFGGGPAPRPERLAESGRRGERLLTRRGEEGAQLIPVGSLAAAPDDRELQRRPVEAADRDEWIAKLKAARDVGSNLWGRGRGESGDGWPPAGCDRRGQQPIVGAKIVAPGRDAVRLVHHDAADAEGGELVDEAWT